MLTLLQTQLKELLGLLTVVPRLRITHIAMHSHQGQIDTRLNPAQHSFDIILIGVLVARTEETTCIIRPPGDTSGLHTQTSNDLTTEGLPVITHITAPHRRAIALDARETATGEDHRLLASLHQTLIDGLVHQQRIDVAHQLTCPFAIVHPTACQVVILRLCGILPPGVDA